VLVTLLAVIGGIALGLGLTLATIGLYGLLRKPDIFGQLHAAGLVTGPAIVLVLLGSVATRDLRVISSAVLMILFLLVTSPLSTHAIAQAAHRGRRDSLRPGAEHQQRQRDGAQEHEHDPGDDERVRAHDVAADADHEAGEHHGHEESDVGVALGDEVGEHEGDGHQRG
jgi:monovalent cation/proton antiporter MnhG/PhaG subunit